MSCTLTILVSTILGKYYAERFIGPLKGLAIVAEMASVIALTAPLLDFASAYTITSTIISTANQLAQYVVNIFQALSAFVRDWFWNSLLNALLNIPLGSIMYFASYYLASSLREQVPY